MKHLWTLFFVLLFALPASAAPTKLAQQGRVLDGDGAPLEGSHEMVFVLYDADTDGTALWTEERSANFEEGYYSITLGEQVPLDDLLFDTESVWLELSIGGETLAPRQEVVSVPYALRATATEHVEGGMVDAAEISVDGTVVIDAAGNWVGPTPSVTWADVADIPADIADGDQDEDTLAGLACAEGQLPKWDAASSLWVCGDDIDTDTTDPNTDTLVSLACSTGQVAKWDGATWACGDDIDTTDPNTDTLLGLPCADGYIAKFDGASGLWDCALDADSFADLAGVCFPGDIPVLDPVSGTWLCGADTDTDTQLSNAEVATAALAEGFVAGAHTLDTDTQLTDAQVAAAATAEGFVTGAHTADTDTQLTQAQVASAALAEGFVTGAHTVDTDTQLSNAQVASAALAEGFVTGAHTADTNTQLTEGQVDTFVANNNYSTGAHTTDTNTQLTESQVDAFVANNNYSIGAHTVDSNTDALAGLSCTPSQVAMWDGNAWVCTDFTTLADQDGDGVPAWSDCDDTNASSGVGGGESATCPGVSCLGILNSGNSTGNGVYWIDPTGSAPFQAYCDHQSTGGGWTRVARLDTVTSGYCGGDPAASFDLSTDPLRPAGKLSDATVEAIINASALSEIMYYTGEPGRAEFFTTTMQDPYDTTGVYGNYCTWTCADGAPDSTTCGGELNGCGFAGSGTGGNTKKLYIDHCTGLHSGGGFCGLDNRCSYALDIFVR